MESACRADFALDAIDQDEPVEGNGALQEIRLGVDPGEFDYDHLSSDPPLVPDETSPSKGNRVRARGASILEKPAEVSKGLWLVLSLLAFSVLMNCVIPGHPMLLGLYTLPVLLSAYFCGRRHAVLSRPCKGLPHGSPCPFQHQALQRHPGDPDHPGPLA